MGLPGTGVEGSSLERFFFTLRAVGRTSARSCTHSAIRRPRYLRLSLKQNININISAPMIYTAPCIMFWMRAYPLRGEVGGGWALKFESFLGPVKWHRADRRVTFIRNQQQTIRCIKGRSGA
jgi:hypothetical protein